MILCYAIITLLLLSLSLEFNSLSLSALFSVCPQYLNLCLCVCCFFLFTTFGLSAYPYDDTQHISHDHRVLLLINIRIVFFCFLLLSVSA